MKRKEHADHGETWSRMRTWQLLLQQTGLHETNQSQSNMQLNVTKITKRFTKHDIVNAKQSPHLSTYFKYYRSTVYCHTWPSSCSFLPKNILLCP